MAVKGLDLFSTYFADFKDAFILIGGAACDLWFAERNLEFRATKDLDVVLILERLTPGFVERFWGFIGKGEYEVKTRNENGPPILYRFARPKSNDFPFMVELFCREDPKLDINPTQHITPVRLEDAQSLSAILLHECYYNFLVVHCREFRGILAADVMALIPLKARAWLDLTERMERGEHVNERDIKKHRNDVFLLTMTLPGERGMPLPAELATDVDAFLKRHPLDHQDWNAIRLAIRPTFGGVIQPEKLISAIRNYYQLSK